MKLRDMTERQYKDALQRHGFSSEGFMGYYKLGTTGTRVSVLNAGPSRRSKLAYLLAEYEKAQQRADTEAHNFEPRPSCCCGLLLVWGHCPNPHAPLNRSPIRAQ